MKRLVSVILAAMLILALCSCSNSDHQRLKEYRELLAEINEEYGVSLAILEEDEQTFLDAYEGKNLDEVREELVASVEKMLDEENNPGSVEPKTDIKLQVGSE